MNRVSVGIDLGTSNTVVFYKYNGKYTGLAFAAGNNNLLPSVIDYTHASDNSDKIIGQAAVNNITRNNRDVLMNTKRVLGVKYDDIDPSQRESLCNVPMTKASDGTVQFVCGNNGLIVTPVTVASDIIKYIIEQVNSATAMELGKVAVTFPASYKQEQRLALKKAIINAGVPMNDLRIVNEPTAAVISYADQEGIENGKLLVYDIGGGTFDVTILQVINGHCRVLAYDGDHDIGGIHFDNIIKEKLLERIRQKFNKPTDFIVNNKRKNAKFMKQVEEVKQLLSIYEAFDISLEDYGEGLGKKSGDPDLSIFCFQSDITAWLNDTLEKTLTIVDRAISKAQLTHRDINKVFFTGGSCEIKCIKNLINDHFRRNTGIRQDICVEAVFAKEHVARGGCIISDAWQNNPIDPIIRIGQNEFFIEDITSTTLSFQTSDTELCPFIYNGTRIDGLVREFLLYDNNLSIGKTTYRFYEGNSTRVSECTFLKEYIITYDRVRDVNQQGSIEYIFSFRIEFDGIVTLEIRNNVNNRVYLAREIISYFHIC